MYFIKMICLEFRDLLLCPKFYEALNQSYRIFQNCKYFYVYM